MNSLFGYCAAVLTIAYNMGFKGLKACPSLFCLQTKTGTYDGKTNMYVSKPQDPMT